jgi:hypothetical protein
MQIEILKKKIKKNYGNMALKGHAYIARNSKKISYKSYFKSTIITFYYNSEYTNKLGLIKS